MTNDLEIKKEISPAEMIMNAVTQNTDLTKLKEAMELQFSWEKRQAEKSYNRAIADFKSNPPEIIKESSVNYDTSKGNTHYKYASLANVIEKVTPALSQYGLSISWRTKQNGKIEVTCRISHELGHYEETSLQADAETSGTKNPIQAIGSAITYMQRYTALALLGLACSDQDDDGISSSIKADRITIAQIKILDDLINTKKLDKALLLTYLEVESLDKLSAKDYMKAISAINVAKKVVK